MTIEGSIRGEGELEVAGRVRGALTINGKLVVEVGGIVEADVEATDIEVAGLLAGSATAHHSVQVLAGGRMEARVKSPRMLVDDGAVFRGELQAQTAAAVEHVAPALSARARSAPALPAKRTESPRECKAPARAPAPAPHEQPAPAPLEPRAAARRGRGLGFAPPPEGAAATPTRARLSTPAEKPAASRPAGPPRMPALPKGRTPIMRRGGEP